MQNNGVGNRSVVRGSVVLLWHLRRWSPTMQRSMASARSCIHSSASAISILENCMRKSSTVQATFELLWIVYTPRNLPPNIEQEKLSSPSPCGSPMFHVHCVDIRNYHQSGPCSLLETSPPDLDARWEGWNLKFCLDDTVSGACHRGDTASAVSSRLTRESRTALVLKARNSTRFECVRWNE